MKLFFILLMLAPSLFAAPLKVVTTTTDLAWAVREIGGALVDVTSLLKGTENPHYVDAVPEFVRLTAESNVVVVVGLDLEVGWMPKVLARSGNAQVQPGGKGYVEAGKDISVLEKPLGAIDRSMGDVHSSGNPHFWLSPPVFAKAMESVTATLALVDPAHAADYRVGLKRFSERMKQIQVQSEKKLHLVRVLAKGPVLVEYHKEFAYFLDAYGLKSLGSIEEKPGITPSAGRLAEVAVAAKTSGVRLGLASETAPKKTLERFTELSGTPVIAGPLSLVPSRGLKDYQQLQDFWVERIVKGLQGPKH